MDKENIFFLIAFMCVIAVGISIAVWDANTYEYQCTDTQGNTIYCQSAYVNKRRNVRKIGRWYANTNNKLQTSRNKSQEF